MVLPGNVRTREEKDQSKGDREGKPKKKRWTELVSNRDLYFCVYSSWPTHKFFQHHVQLRDPVYEVACPYLVSIDSVP
jgi:hypothetical protein